MKHEFKIEFELFEQIYLCKYYGKVSNNQLALGLNTKVSTIIKTIEKLKKQGLYEKYRNMEDKEWLKTEKQKSFDRKYIKRSDKNE